MWNKNIMFICILCTFLSAVYQSAKKYFGKKPVENPYPELHAINKVCIKFSLKVVSGEKEGGLKIG